MINIISTAPRYHDAVASPTEEKAKEIKQLVDDCVVPAVGVNAEYMVELLLDDVLLDKIGGDSLSEVKRNLFAYLDTLN